MRYLKKGSLFDSPSLKIERKKKMKLSNKQISTAVALILTMTLTILNVLPVVFADTDIDTYAYCVVAPNPVGVGQPVTVSMWIDKLPPLGESNEGLYYVNSFALDITKPDGTTSTMGPMDSDWIGSQHVSYTPSDVGTYYFQFRYLGEVLELHGAERSGQVAVDVTDRVGLADEQVRNGVLWQDDVPEHARYHHAEEQECVEQQHPAVLRRNAPRDPAHRGLGPDRGGAWLVEYPDSAKLGPCAAEPGVAPAAELRPGRPAGLPGEPGLQRPALPQPQRGLCEPRPGLRRHRRRHARAL